MSNIIIKGTPPDCPLCKKKMQKIIKEGITYFACFEDMVNINAADPILGNWEGILSEPMPCPVCNTNMRYFVRSDGWFKAKCPQKECGSTIDSGE